MAGHSQFANIKHRKGAQDAKRSKLFTKLRRQIVVAAREGAPDPDQNSRLRSAVYSAKREGLPKDKIEAAIKSAASNESSNAYEEVLYEGYASGGIAVLVQALTDNKNRTASELRHTFAKHGGNLAESGSVVFMFDRLGKILYKNHKDANLILDYAIEVGAKDVAEEDEMLCILCCKSKFYSVLEALSQRFCDPEFASLIWLPKNKISTEADKKESLLKMLDVLQENDDVESVTTNLSS
jgi:YebC/PmpR family DNA-binding regulatory protein